MSLNYLKSFYFVAREKSISKASELLHVQQPALSKTIKKLEEELGFELLIRRSRGVDLTSEGEIVFGQCEAIFSHVKTIIDFKDGSDIRLNDSFRVSTIDLLSKELISKALIKHKEEYPSVRPIISCDTVTLGLKDIQDKKSDLGVFLYTPKLPRDLVVYKKFKIPFKLVISKSAYHSKSIRNQFIGSREVEDQKEIDFPALKIMREKIGNVQIHFSSNSLLTHKQMVLNGMGVSILPAFFVKEELSNGLLKELLKEEEFEFSLKFIVRKGERLSSYAQELIELIEEVL